MVERSSVVRKAILLGNGANRCSGGPCWGKLVRDLWQDADLGVPYSGNREKPFPLVYEEIVLRSLHRQSGDEKRIKRKIAELSSDMQSDVIHREIMAADADELLTTNYDQALEMAVGLDARDLKNDGYIRERRYSLFRRHAANGKVVWHIHGMCSKPDTIALGYDHYSGHLQQIRLYVTTGLTYSSKGAIPRLTDRLKASGDVHILSWVDLFFTHSVYILGLSLDFVEIHLWWLLAYRARLAGVKGIRVRNRVCYLTPNGPERQKNRRAVLELLEAYGVEVVPLALRNDDWSGFYRDAVAWINQQ